MLERVLEDAPAEQRPQAGAPSAAAGIGRQFGNQRGTSKPRIRERPTYANQETAEAIDQAIDWNPDASFAAWIYKRLGLDEYEVRALGEDGEPDDELLAEVEAFAGRVMTIYGGGTDAIRNVALDSILRRGAAAPELDVADSLDDVVEVDFVDPIHIDVEALEDGDHKWSRWVYCGQGGSDPVPFNPAQFCVFAIGQKVGQPHGQSPFLPLVDTVFPHTELRNSLQRVAKNQAFSRILLSYSVEALMKGAPSEMVKRVDGAVTEVVDAEGFQDYVSGFVDDLSSKLDTMMEDDNWILPNSITSSSLGANHAGESIDFQKLGQLFEQDVIASVKNQPAIHGRQWGSDLSSTGSIQWKVQALGIEAMIEPANRACEFVLNQWLRISGRRGSVEVVSPALEKSDRLAEAQARQIETNIWMALYDQGVIGLDELAQNTVGHEPPEVADAPVETGRITTEQVLNGAQVSSAQSIITDIALGVLPRETGVNMISAFFNLPRETVDEIIGAVGREPVEPEPEPAPEPEPGTPDTPDTPDEEEPADDAPSGDDDPGDEGRGVPNAGHRASCSCGSCKPELGATREPFEPADTDALNSVEMVDEPDPDEDDADRVRRAWDARMRRRGLSTFVGLLDAVVVSSAPEDENGRAPRAWTQRASDPPAGRWQWDETLARFRYPSKGAGRLGRLLPENRAFTLMDIGRRERQGQADRLAKALTENRISVIEWQEQMRGLVKDAHLEARMAAVGGRNNMTFSDYGTVGRYLQDEYAKLGEIGQDIASGRYSAAQIRDMSRRRFEAQVRETFRRGEQDVKVRAGYAEEQNELESSAEHCAGCEAETARGWVATGSIVPIGARDCSLGCACRIRYRVSEDQPRPASRAEGARAWVR